MLSYGIWKGRFGATNAILGKSIQVNNRSVSIIGVMPPDFQYPNKQAELWLLLTSDPRWPTFQRFRIADAFNGLGRLKPGRSIEEARAEMKVVSSKLAQQYPATDTGLEYILFRCSTKSRSGRCVAVSGFSEEQLFVCCSSLVRISQAS